MRGRRVVTVIGLAVCFWLAGLTSGLGGGVPAAYAASDGVPVDSAVVVAAAGKLSGSDTRVFDQAGLLTEQEAEDLEGRVSDLRARMKMDVVLVTTDDAGRRDSRSYADDFYDNHGFGTGSDASGVLFLIDMDNREIYISTTGMMIRHLTDQRIDSILDNCYDYMVDGDYAGAMKQFLADLEHEYQKGIQSGQYNYDEETGRRSVYRSIRWYEALIAIVAAAVCAGGACLNVVNSYGMKRERKHALGAMMAYRADAKYAMGIRNDILRDTSVSRSIIVRSSTGSGSSRGSSSGRSSTHSSSSGRSHGGGGRKF